MEFLDMLVRVLGGCDGSLEVMTILFDSAAVYLGIRTFQKQKHVAEKLAHHHAKAAPIKKPAWWPVVVLGVFAVAFTALTAWKYLHGVR